MRVALTAAAAITPLRYYDDAVLLIEDGIIAAIGPRERCELPRNVRLVNFPDGVIVPGFIDIHLHGGAGHDVMSADSEAMAALERHLARHGVTSYLPTTVTAPVEHTLSALSSLADRVKGGRSTNGEPAACPVGIHLEGPFISHAKRGAHPAEHIQAPSVELFERFWNAAKGQIKLLTLAPELPGALDVIAAADERGVCVAMGHSDADYGLARAGIAAGARHATHTFNAMHTLGHRDPGIVAAVLTDSYVSAEIICDGLHVAPAMVELFLRMKGREAAVLVTDAISATGMPDGRYRLGVGEVQLQGERCLSPDGRLAGSILTMDRAVRNAREFARRGLEDVVPMVTTNPARVAGLGISRGALVPGARADVLVLSRQGEVLQTIVQGRGL